MFPQCLLEIVFGSSLSLDFHLISTKVILLLAQYELETFMCSLIFVFYMWLATIEFPLPVSYILFTVSEVDGFFAPHTEQIHYIVCVGLWISFWFIRKHT